MCFFYCDSDYVLILMIAGASNAEFGDADDVHMRAIFTYIYIYIVFFKIYISYYMIYIYIYSMRLTMIMMTVAMGRP